MKPAIIKYDDGDAPPTLGDLQLHVGGIIQMLQMDDAQFIFHEEGKMLGYPINTEATALVAHLLFPGDYIAGPMVILIGSARID